ncbi:hypothetical protein P0Y35_04530 [Kiritimatiellaeota bacterium B1221]|nr:hypothetical protein [Kiritimatiellaeota bacterium B1221]
MEKHIDLNTILRAEVTQAATLLSSHVRHCARAAVLNMIQEEVELLCGASYNPSSESACFRAGSAPTSIYVEGKRESVIRPRVRELTEEGTREVTIKTLQAARDPHEWEDIVHRAMLCGVSGRDQARLQAHELKGMTKSNISRLWAQRAGTLIREMNETDLSD